MLPLLVTVAGLLLAVAAAGSPPATGPSPEFRIELEDPHGNPVVFPAVDPTAVAGGTPVTVLVVADRAGAAASREWGEALGERYADRLTGTVEPALAVLAVAHLEAVPALLRGAVRRSFRDGAGASPLPIALDWRGEAARQLDFVPGVPNLAVVGAGGTLHLQLAAWPADGEARRRLFAALDELLAR